MAGYLLEIFLEVVRTILTNYFNHLVGTELDLSVAPSLPDVREGTTAMPRAVFNGTVLAQADQTVVVEGNHYFPPDSLNWDHLQKSSSKTVCPWKGLANYHDLIVGGTIHRDAGWHYPRPSPLARRIRGHVAFDHRVIIEPTDHDVPRRRFLDRLRSSRS